MIQFEFRKADYCD